MGKTRQQRVIKILEDTSALYKMKSSDYGNAYIVATDIMDILVPDKSVIKTRLQKLVYHNMYAIVAKLLRASSIVFSQSGKPINDKEPLTDSWRDIGLYAFMIEELCDSEEI